MRQLQLVAHGEPSDVIELNTVSTPALGDEDVLVSMEAAPLNPSDFLLVRGIYGVRPVFPFSVGAEGVGRVTQTGSKVDVALQGKRVLILPTYEQGTWADQVVVPVRNIVPMSDEADPLQLSMIGRRARRQIAWTASGAVRLVGLLCAVRTRRARAASARTCGSRPRTRTPSTSRPARYP
jgi:NADPH:quinone reductase-like Zn-dependent oxidoreductase